MMCSVLLFYFFFIISILIKLIKNANGIVVLDKSGSDYIKENFNLVAPQKIIPTSTKIKPEKWCTNYFVQEMFYAAAYYELTEIPITKLITLMVTPDGEVKVFDKRNKGDYIKLLVRYIKEFVSHNTRSPNGQ